MAPFRPFKQMKSAGLRSIAELRRNTFDGDPRTDRPSSLFLNNSTDPFAGPNELLPFSLFKNRDYSLLPLFRFCPFFDLSPWTFNPLELQVFRNPGSEFGFRVFSWLSTAPLSNPTWLPCERDVFA